MTKKHFEHFARLLKLELSSRTLSPADVQRCADIVSAVARTDNPRFDRSRFERACGLAEPVDLTR
jgi:hypothetical protein